MRFFLLFFVIGAVFSLSALDLARNGKSCVQIVVNPRAGKLEKMAAQDLKTFLDIVWRLVRVPDSKVYYYGRTNMTKLHRLNECSKNKKNLLKGIDKYKWKW